MVGGVIWLTTVVREEMIKLVVSNAINVMLVIRMF